MRRRLIVVSLFPKARRKAKGKLGRIESLLSESRDGFFDLDGVHLPGT